MSTTRKCLNLSCPCHVTCTCLGNHCFCGYAITTTDVHGVNKSFKESPDNPMVGRDAPVENILHVHRRINPNYLESEDSCLNLTHRTESNSEDKIELRLDHSVGDDLELPSHIIHHNEELHRRVIGGAFSHSPRHLIDDDDAHQHKSIVSHSHHATTLEKHCKNHMCTCAHCTCENCLCGKK